jgi:nitric oxide reductase NorD protein
MSRTVVANEIQAMTRDTAAYALIATAVVGRRIAIRTSSEPGLSFSDGQEIVLAAPAPTSASESESELPFWPVVAAQAALIAAGSLDASLVRRLAGRGETIDRYVYLEVLRASQLCEDRMPWAFSRRPELLHVAPLTESAASSLELALGAQALPRAPAYFGTVRPLIALRRALQDEGFAALTRKQQLGKIQQREAKELGDDEEGESSLLLKLIQSPLSISNPLADLLSDLLGMGATKGKRDNKPDDGGGAEIAVGRIERALRRGVHAVLAKLPVSFSELGIEADGHVHAYPEWDVHARAYRRDWVFVEEVDPSDTDANQNTDPALEPSSRHLRQQLGKLGLDHEMHRRQNEGADLDTDALIDRMIELRAEHAPAAMNVYRASRRTRRDLAVMIVLDISGSTGEQDDRGETPFKKQLQLAYQLAHALDSLGDTVAMVGFHSWGRKLMQVVRLKGHKERWSGAIAQRMALLKPVGYTRTGAAVRHGARILRTDIGLPNRLLLLITDGVAYDQDYERTYAEADTRRALEEARAAGTACVCLSVGSSIEADKLAQLFGSASILAVDEVQQLTVRIHEVLRRALASVSRRRFGQPSPSQTIAAATS